MVILIAWKLWNERKGRVFENKHTLAHLLAQQIQLDI